jgi:hypothetical protein
MNDHEDAIRRRRLALILVLVIALCAIGTVAVLSSRDEDPLAGTKSPPRSTVTPIARIVLEPTDVAPRRARGLAEAVRRDGAHELRLIAQNLPRAREDESYRVYLARGDAEKTLGRLRPDKRGTLLGEARIEASDLTEFAALRVARESSAGSQVMLSGKLPR